MTSMHAASWSDLDVHRRRIIGDLYDSHRSFISETQLVLHLGMVSIRWTTTAMASAEIFTSLDGSSLHVKILKQVRTPLSPTPSSVAHTKSSARIRCPRGSSHRTGFTVVLLCRTKDRNGATSADAPDLGTTHFPSRTSAGSLCALPGELLQHMRCVSCLVANRKGRGEAVVSA